MTSSVGCIDNYRWTVRGVRVVVGIGLLTRSPRLRGKGDLRKNDQVKGKNAGGNIREVQYSAQHQAGKLVKMRWWLL